jgi:hypothetical protein
VIRSVRLSTVSFLAGMAYLGFYVFGLVLGVYSPGEVPYLTIPAALIVIASVAYLIHERRTPAAEADEEALVASRRRREERGF